MGKPGYRLDNLTAMKKYLVTVHFKWDEEAMKLIPEHREYINELIDEQVIENYVVSMEVQTVWITMNAKNKTEVKKILGKSPFRKFWDLEVNELIVWDGQNYRLPVVQLN
jgi:hypothetical protein